MSTRFVKCIRRKVPGYYYFFLFIVFLSCFCVITSHNIMNMNHSDTGQVVIKHSMTETSVRRTNPRFSTVISSTSDTTSSVEQLGGAVNWHRNSLMKLETCSSKQQDRPQIIQNTFEAVRQNPSEQNLTEYREWIIQKLRKSLAQDMTSYQFQGGQRKRKLEDMVLEQGGKPIRNLVITSWRSGSSFLGSLVASNPGTNYVFEPLIQFEQVKFRSEHSAEEGLRIIRNFLNCNYGNLAKTTKSAEFKWFKRHKWPKLLLRICAKNHEVCMDPSFRTRICKLFPFQALKIVRLQLHLTEPLLEDSDLDIRVLLLIRDPRGTMQSRLHLGWCSGKPDCDNTHNHCSDMEADFHAATKLQQEYPGRVMALRYEDICTNPYSAAKKLFKFFRLQYHPLVEKFLDSHTASDHGGDYSTFRNSSANAFHWREDFLNKFDEVKRIQASCEKAMYLWGYRLAKNKDDMMENHPVLEPPWQEMIIPEDGKQQNTKSSFV